MSRLFQRKARKAPGESYRPAVIQFLLGYGFAIIESLAELMSRHACKDGPEIWSVIASCASIVMGSTFGHLYKGLDIVTSAIAFAAGGATTGLLRDAFGMTTLSSR
jgi:hypothetical protein